MNCTYIALKLNNMKKLIQKIELINNMIPAVNMADKMPVTYAGGTWPYYVFIKPIRVTRYAVVIEAATTFSDYNFIKGVERYSIKNQMDELNYTLNTILKTFKKVTK